MTTLSGVGAAVTLLPSSPGFRTDPRFMPYPPRLSKSVDLNLVIAGGVLSAIEIFRQQPHRE